MSIVPTAITLDVEPKPTFVYKQPVLSFEQQIFQARMNGELPSYCEKFGKYLECEQNIEGKRVRVECEENGKELTCERI